MVSKRATAPESIYAYVRVVQRVAATVRMVTAKPNLDTRVAQCISALMDALCIPELLVENGEYFDSIIRFNDFISCG